MFEKLQKNVGDVLEFPPEVTGDGPKITITGRQEIVVEKFQEVIAFSEEEIRLQTAEGELAFYGKGFVLKTLLSAEIRIAGELVSLAFAKREGK